MVKDIVTMFSGGILVGFVAHFLGINSALAVIGGWTLVGITRIK